MCFFASPYMKHSFKPSVKNGEFRSVIPVEPLDGAFLRN